MADARWTHLFWIDADIGFEPEAALRLLLAGHDVVAGVYPLKIDGWPAEGLDERRCPPAHARGFRGPPCAFSGQRLAGARAVDADGFIEVLDAPTGFMLIARSVFERLAARMPELRYTPDAATDPTRPPRLAALPLLRRAWPSRTTAAT